MQQPTIVFIHGFMGHSSDWDDLRDELSDHKTISINVPTSQHWDETVRSIAETIPSNTVLVGYSMGARLALGVALTLQESIQGLVFISGNPGLESELDRKQRWVADQQLAGRIENEDIGPFLQDWYRQSVFANTPEAIRNAEAKRKLTYDSTTWPQILLANSVSKQPNLWPQAAKLSVPVLAIAGKEDEKYAKIAVRLIEENQHPQSRVEIVPDCGHVVHRERQKSLAKMIHDFVSNQG